MEDIDFNKAIPKLLLYGTFIESHSLIDHSTFGDILMQQDVSYISSSKATHYSNCKLQYVDGILTSDKLTQYGHKVLGDFYGIIPDNESDVFLTFIMKQIYNSLAVSPSTSLACLQSLLLMHRLIVASAVPIEVPMAMNTLQETIKRGVSPYEF